MPKVHAQADMPTVSATTDVVSTTLYRRRHASAKLEGKSRTYLSGKLGRLRELSADPKKALRIASVSTMGVSGARCKRHAGADMATKSVLRCDRLALIPAVGIKPSGQIICDGKPLSGQRLQIGESYAFNFSIEGQRLAGMQISFAAKRLTGEMIIHKTRLKAPGGIFVDTTIEDAAGKVSLTGIVPIYPTDPEAKTPIPESEIECRFVFEVSDDLTSRRYEIKSGTFTFYRNQ